MTQQTGPGAAEATTPQARLGAIAEALLVTVLWSSSWVLIKIGLGDLPPLVFAGLRYTLAAALLAPLAIARLRAGEVPRRFGRSELAELALLGVVFYAVTQGAQFAALALLPAATLALILSMTPLLVASVSWLVTSERPTPLQWVGTAAVVVGAVIYLGADLRVFAAPAGLAVASLCLAANAAAALLGRRINRRGGSAVVVTGVSMAVGAPVLLAAGVATEGVPTLSARAAAIVVVLATVNTAFAFTLWNRSLRHLTAIESSVINNTMMIQIALLAWLFLGEALTVREVMGLAVAAAGVLIVQLRR